MKNMPGPRSAPGRLRPSLYTTALSYSCTGLKKLFPRPHFSFVNYLPESILSPAAKKRGVWQPLRKRKRKRSVDYIFLPHRQVLLGRVNKNAIYHLLYCNTTLYRMFPEIPPAPGILSWSCSLEAGTLGCCPCPPPPPSQASPWSPWCSPRPRTSPFS